jgi:hypothetical protein
LNKNSKEFKDFKEKYLPYYCLELEHFSECLYDKPIESCRHYLNCSRYEKEVNDK